MSRLHKILEDPLLLAHILGYTKVKTSIHEEWIREVWRPGFNHTQAHRNSYKTTCRVIAWIWGQFTHKESTCLIARKSIDEARAVINEIAMHYEKPPLRALYKKEFGIEEPRNLAYWSPMGKGISLITKKKATKERGLEPSGVGKPRTGAHYDLIICDDIVNIDDRYSKAERKKTIRYYGELNNIIKNDGIGIKVSGTPWHKEDAYSKMDPPRRYPIELQFIEDLTSERIAEIKKGLDESEFQANYHLRHVQSEEKPFAKPNYTNEYCEGQNYGFLDPSKGESKNNDSSALTIGRYQDKIFHVNAGFLWKKRLDQTYDEVENYCKRFNIHTLYIEANKMQEAFVVEFRRRKINCVAVNSITNKHVRIIHYVKKNWERIVFHNSVQKEYMKEIMDYIDPDISEHDDAPDSLAGFVASFYRKKRRGGIQIASISV